MGSALTKAVHSKVGKIIRWVASNGIGIIPVTGQILGPALDALDTFLLEKVLPDLEYLCLLTISIPQSLPYLAHKLKGSIPRVDKLTSIHWNLTAEFPRTSKAKWSRVDKIIRQAAL